MHRMRRATLADVHEILTRTRALNLLEDITVDDAALEAAVRVLLTDANLGGVWLVETDHVVGHAVVTFGYDLEFAGRDAFLTELYVDEDARGEGAASALLDHLQGELRALGAHALHLQVRADNPALRLYERQGFARSPRILMTRRL